MVSAVLQRDDLFIVLAYGLVQSLCIAEELSTDTDCRIQISRCTM